MQRVMKTIVLLVTKKKTHSSDGCTQKKQKREIECIACCTVHVFIEKKKIYFVAKVKVMCYISSF